MDAVARADALVEVYRAAAVVDRLRWSRLYAELDTLADQIRALEERRAELSARLEVFEGDMLQRSER